MKRLLILAACAALLISGCAAGEKGNIITIGPSPSPSSSSAASPTPAPEGVEYVFGKTIKVALVSFAGDAEFFFAGAEAQAKILGIETVRVSGTGAAAITASGANAALCYGPGAGDASALSALTKSVSVAVFTDQSANVPGGASSIVAGSMAEDAAVQAAMNALLAYPPHDTPVRILGMHAAKDSLGDKLCAALYSQGKLLRRSTYYQNTETAAAKWAETALTSTYAAGMLDAIYADNASLALAAYQALKKSDHYGVEIFCPEMTGEILAAMAESPKRFAGAVGANEAGAGALCLRMATSMLLGASPMQETIESRLFLSNELIEGGMDAAIALDGMGGICQAKWMDYLKEYYSAANAPSPTPTIEVTPSATPGVTASPAASATPAASASPAA